VRAPDSDGAVLVDLTLPITADMPFNPDHFPPELEKYATIESDGWEARRLVLDSHLGTHMDAPSHFVAGGATLEAVPLDVLVGPAQVIRIDGLEDREEIAPKHLAGIEWPRVILATGWSRGIGDRDRYFGRFPYIGEEAAQMLIDAGARLVAIDGPSVDYDGRTHVLLLSNGVIVVENLVGAVDLPARCQLIVTPLPIVGGDGCPVRAIAELAA
jgi:arylformamidase